MWGNIQHASATNALWYRPRGGTFRTWNPLEDQSSGSWAEPAGPVRNSSRQSYELRAMEGLSWRPLCSERSTVPSMAASSPGSLHYERWGTGSIPSIVCQSRGTRYLLSCTSRALPRVSSELLDALRAKPKLSHMDHSQGPYQQLRRPRYSSLGRSARYTPDQLPLLR